MKQRITFYALLFINSVSFAQRAGIKEIKLLPDESFFYSEDSTIVWPVFYVKDKDAEKKINSVLQNDLASSFKYAGNDSVLVILQNATAKGLIGFKYNIHMNQNNLLSVELNYVWGNGPKATFQNDYFTFDITTGKSITLNDLLRENYKTAFIQATKENHGAALISESTQLDNLMAAKRITQEDYTAAKFVLAKSCNYIFNAGSFYIDTQFLTIIIECNLPRMVDIQSSYKKVEFKLNDIKKWLNEKYYVSFDM